MAYYGNARHSFTVKSADSHGNRRPSVQRGSGPAFLGPPDGAVSREAEVAGFLYPEGVKQYSQGRDRRERTLG